MAVIVFLLGRPGSGKSRVARCIKGDQSPVASDMEEKGLLEKWEVLHFTDYKYLLRMFQEEELRSGSEERCFGPSEYGGFNVTEFGFSRSVLDKALEQVNRDILQEIESGQKQKLILVEFARSDYRSIKNIFDVEILENAFVLCLQTDLDICVGRVHQRVRYPQWEDDSFISDEIMMGYYGTEDFDGLQKAFGEERVEVIDSNGDWNNTWIKVKEFVSKAYTVYEGDSIELSEERSAGFSTAPPSIKPFLEPFAV